ncbi:hypothetical protein [Massilia sp. TSP1-1-2]|uniref:hypothetical protein n=1 Tax=Massilia sp. TSP1-1-2 TaxID=2804649 RepID=UPI003CFB4966
MKLILASRLLDEAAHLSLFATGWRQLVAIFLGQQNATELAVFIPNYNYFGISSQLMLNPPAPWVWWRDPKPYGVLSHRQLCFVEFSSRFPLNVEKPRNACKFDKTRH